MNHFWVKHRCLVTGAGGFGGGHLCEKLVTCGAVVYGVDRFFSARSYLAISGVANQIECVSGDVIDTQFFVTLLERFNIQTIFHLAAQPIVPFSNAFPSATVQSNVVATYSVLEAIRISQATNRLVFASSGAYYGESRSALPIPEEQAPGIMHNVYAATKVASDVAVRCYARTFGIQAAVCRFINTYGPGDTNFSRIIPRAVSHLIRNQEYTFGDRDDGTTCLDYLHVRDMSEAYVCVAEHLDELSGDALNFGTGETFSTREVTRMTSLAFDGRDRKAVFLGPPRTDPLLKCLDISKARDRLGWQAKYRMIEGLPETIDWYRRNWVRL